MGNLPNTLNIQSKLHVCRAEMRLTQQQLADEVGVTRATIVALEKGNYNPSLELCFRLSRYFKKPIEEIFYIQESQTKSQQEE